MAARWPGPVIRARGARLRADRRGAVGAVPRGAGRHGPAGLTLEDGSLVVTDNYLKVRIPAGLTRNERVRVRVAGLAAGLWWRLASG